MSYGKLDSNIINSSMWSEPCSTRVLWVTMIAMSDENGFVASSIPGLIRASNITEEEFVAGIKSIESPDKYSRTPEFEGRRAEKVDGGWILVNHEKYRLPCNVQREQTRERVRKFRAKRACNVTESLLSVSASESDLGDRSVREGEKESDPTWWISMEEYLSMARDAYNRLCEDSVWIEHLKRLRPRLDIGRSLRLAYENYWGTEKGFAYYTNKPKKKRTRNPNFKLGFQNSLGWKEQVEYLPREQQ